MIGAYLLGAAAAQEHTETALIEGRISVVVGKFLAATAVERQALTLEYMLLQEALEDAQRREHSNP